MQTCFIKGFSPVVDFIVTIVTNKVSFRKEKDLTTIRASTF